MNWKNIPKKVFDSPSVAFVNFIDGSFVNLIRLDKPYKNGVQYAVYHNANEDKGFSGLFKSAEHAKGRFNQVIRYTWAAVRSSGVIDPSIGYPNHIKPIEQLNNFI